MALVATPTSGHPQNGSCLPKIDSGGDDCMK